MIKAIIFDCFGVLTTDGWKQIREEFFMRDEKLYQHSLDMDKAVNAGMMDYDDFLDEISTLSGLTITDVRARMNGTATNSSLFECIRDELKPNYKIGMLSNAAANWLGELFEPWQVDLFDQKVLSYETMMTKPDPRIYQLILEKLGVQPEEAVFIDDSERYCIAAADLGIKTIHHLDTNNTIKKIKELVHA